MLLPCSKIFNGSLVPIQLIYRLSGLAQKGIHSRVPNISRFVSNYIMYIPHALANLTMNCFLIMLCVSEPPFLCSWINTTSVLCQNLILSLQTYFKCQHLLHKVFPTPSHKGDFLSSINFHST